MTETVTAKGISGTLYTYYAVEPNAVLWNPVPINYLFASRGIGGWKVHYIGQTDDASLRMPNHDRWDEATKKYGATHILSHQSLPNEQTRCDEEKDLIQSHDPPMNTYHRRGTGARLLG